MSLSEPKPHVRLLIDSEIGGALKIFAESLTQQVTSCIADVEDFRTPYHDQKNIDHFAAWYLYNGTQHKTSPDRTLITIHHLIRWNEAMDQIVSDQIPLTTMSSEWYRFLKKRTTIRNLSIVPHGINPDEWLPRTREERSDRLNVGIIGRVYDDGRKGERLIARIFSLLPSKHFRATIIGYGWNEAAAKIRSMGIDVDYTESLSFAQLKKTCSTFDIFLCTSDIEGGPLPLLETMAMGITPVSTPVGLARDLLPGTGLGYIFPKGNAYSAASILRKLRSRKLPMIPSERLRSVACTLSWNNAAKGYEKIYHAMATRTKLPLDPTGYFEWLIKLRLNSPLPLHDRLSICANPEPTDRWTQPMHWRAWNKLARSLFRTWD